MTEILPLQSTKDDVSYDFLIICIIHLLDFCKFRISLNICQIQVHQEYIYFLVWK